MQHSTIDYFSFTIILDEFISPESGKRINQFGGGGPQTAFGMRLWSDNVGLVAKVGEDLKDTPEVLSDLQGLHIDQTGLRFNDQPMLRAFQKLDQDGNRQQVWQVSNKVVRSQLGNLEEAVPEHYRNAKGIHLGVHPAAPDWELLSFLNSLPGLISIETFRPPAKIMKREIVKKLLSYADIFSPNVSEARAMIGGGSPADLIRRFLDYGCKVIVLRAGTHGSFIGNQESGEIYHIPAYPNAAVNIIGAGNAYCGGFLTGWVDCRDILEAGLRGAASASLFISHLGYPEINKGLVKAAITRKGVLRDTVRIINA